MAEKRGYSALTAALHLVMAVGIFYLFALSWWMLALPWGDARPFPYQMHKNVGLTVILLVVIILFDRFRRRPGPLPRSMSGWMRKLAIVDHAALYFLILLACLSGYLSSAYSGWGITFWWTVDLPNWGEENEPLNQFFSDIHIWACWALFAVLATHIGGALYHAFRNDGVVRRMLRF
ncbi:cytochrome b [Thiohalorhabdus methylotrophus]|uniref:Cytochrome b n=1 Tax=Thiohalorhabdus methylotrophus TaxID=3242694 RepID=A0ABV4TWZ4_9GAMM